MSTGSPEGWRFAAHPRLCSVWPVTAQSLAQGLLTHATLAQCSTPERAGDVVCGGPFLSRRTESLEFPSSMLASHLLIHFSADTALDRVVTPV